MIRQIVFSTNLYRASLQVGGPARTRSHCPGTDGAFILESTYILSTYLFYSLIFSTIYFTQISLFPSPPALSSKAASGMQVLGIGRCGPGDKHGRDSARSQRGPGKMGRGDGHQLLPAQGRGHSSVTEAVTVCSWVSCGKRVWIQKLLLESQISHSRASRYLASWCLDLSPLCKFFVQT